MHWHSVFHSVSTFSSHSSYGAPWRGRQPGAGAGYWCCYSAGHSSLLPGFSGWSIKVCIKDCIKDSIKVCIKVFIKGSIKVCIKVSSRILSRFVSRFSSRILSGVVSRFSSRILSRFASRFLSRSLSRFCIKLYIKDSIKVCIKVFIKVCISKTIWGLRFEGFQIKNNHISVNWIPPKFMNNFSTT